MQRPAGRVVVAVLVLLASSVAASALAAGEGTAAVGTNGSDASAALSTEQISGTLPGRPSSLASGSGQFDSHESIRVTQEYRLTPGEPGRIDVRWYFEMPEDVDSLRTRLPEDATNVRATQFRQNDREFYEWTEEGSSGSVTFTREVNVTGVAPGPEGTDGRYKFVDAGQWALVRREPSAPVGYRYYGEDPGVTYRNSTAGPGTVGSRLVFLGTHRTYERTDHGQTFRLVVPEAATLVEERSDILDSVTDASDRLRVGDRDRVVTMFVAPTSVSWGVRGLQSGQRDFYVVANETLDTPDNAWLHEYVHTRQDIDRGEETEWFTEGSAEYYAALLTLEQDRIGYEAFRNQLDRGTRAPFEDVRLVDPGTWRSNSGNYYKGALVAATTDRLIREATDGEATLQDVWRRMNEQQSQVTQSDFVRYVERAASDGVADEVRSYTETTARSNTWSRETHSDAFGPLPPSLRFGLSRTGSDGFRVRGPYREGPVDGSALVTGETLVLDVNVTNVGGAGPYDFNLTADERTVASRSGRLDAGTSVTETVEHTFSEPGIYRLRAGEERLTVTVHEPATLVVTSLTADRTRVRPGERVTVTGRVENFADWPGQGQVRIELDGTEIASEDVRLTPGQSTNVTVTTTLREEGTHLFQAGGKVTSVAVSTGATRPTAGPDGTETTGVDGRNRDGSEGNSTGSAGPGFGVVAALLALVASLLVRHRLQ